MPKGQFDRIIDRQNGTAGRASQYSVGASSGSDVVADHTHDEADVLDLDTRHGIRRDTIAASSSETIAVDEQLIVHGSYTVNGTLTNHGKLVVL
jgi:hypothetical protein